MSLVFNMIGGGAGETASIFVYGDNITSSDTCYATKDSKTYYGVWGLALITEDAVDKHGNVLAIFKSGFLISKLNKYGTYTVTISNLAETKTKDVYVNSASRFDVNIDITKVSRVGGRIFHIVEGDNGAEYSFYDVSGNAITDISVDGLASAYYYTKTGTSSADKFYVYDTTNGLQSSKRWGWYNTSCGVTATAIGTGKSNTATVLVKGVPTDYTPNIWGYIKDTMRAGNVGGCNDWYIGSKGELEALRTSGTPGASWFSSNYIWSSSEDSSDNPARYAWYWYCYDPFWDYDYKFEAKCCVAQRSF